MGPETDFVKTGVWILGLGIVALGLPNTLQILAQYQPALGPLPEGGAVGPRFRWEPSPVWALVVAVIGAIGMLHLGGQSEFLYWQF
jgi:hypothetical protein